VFCGNTTNVQSGFARGFGGNGTNRSDAQRGKRFHDVELQRLRTIYQGANCIGTGEQKPIEGTQFAKRLIERSKSYGG